MRDKPADWTEERYRKHLLDTLESKKKRLALLQRNKAPKRLIEREQQQLREAELNVRHHKAQE